MPNFAVNASIYLLGFITMVAFAANSVFCRLALTSNNIGPIDFTGLRIASGAIVLLPIALWNHQKLWPTSVKSWLASIYLLVYALFFSLAYVRLSTGAGALILFATVQMTMIGTSIAKGNKLSKSEGGGVILAMVGLAFMLLPSAKGPTWVGALLMILSGVGWGLYSLLGKEEEYPIIATARNFLFIAPFGFLLLLFKGSTLHLDSPEAMMAIASGGLTSGLGYILWYLLLRHISITVASVLQLSVPAIAAFGGVLFAQEILDFRLLVASLVILGGILLTIVGKRKKTG